MKKDTTLLISNLTILAGAVNDEFSGNQFFTGDNVTPEMQEIAKVMEEAKANDRKAAAISMAHEIMEMDKLVTETIEFNRQSLANLRREIDIKRSRIERLAVARLYAMRTNNFLPLAVELGRLEVSHEAMMTQPKFSIPPLEAHTLLQEIRASQAKERTATTEKTVAAKKAPVARKTPAKKS